MEILSFTTEFKTPVCIALGFFDCVHLGHKALIDKVRNQASSMGAKACAVTFSNNPYHYLKKDDKLLFTFDERLKIFDSCGLDCVILLPFTRNFMSKHKSEFLNELCERFNVKGLVCGHDYRFGANAEGNAEFLAEYCAKNDIMCDIIQPITSDGTRISTTLIRSLIACGEIEKAESLLGHSYFIDGFVCHGRGVGKIFDFPTANIRCDDDKLLPACGVYATVTHVGEKKYKSVTNVGNKPTFEESGVTVETMLTDFCGDLYDKKITVEFVRKLRDIRKFPSPQALGKQIHIDANWR